MRRNSVTSSTQDLPRKLYLEVALQTFELMEAFALELFPLYWGGLKTAQQAQILSLVFSRHMLGKPVTVAELARELGHPRSSVQHAVESLIDLGRIEAKTDPEDGRKKLLKIPTRMAGDAGAIEELTVQFRLRWHEELARLLETRKRQEAGPPE